MSKALKKFSNRWENCSYRNPLTKTKNIQRFIYLISEHFSVKFENRDDQLDSFNWNVKLFVKCHVNDTIFKFGCKEFQFSFQIFIAIQGLECLQTFQTNITNFVMDCPTYSLIYKMAIIILSNIIKKIQNISFRGIWNRYNSLKKRRYKKVLNETS